MNGSQRRAGADCRGKARDRRRRREILIFNFARVVLLGGYEFNFVDGLHWVSREEVRIPCTHCGFYCTLDEFEVDRHPIPGYKGGRYTLNNIVPACKRCNARRNHPKLRA